MLPPHLPARARESRFIDPTCDGNHKQDLGGTQSSAGLSHLARYARVNVQTRLVFEERALARTCGGGTRTRDSCA
jgi:hypothetical protein